MICAGSAAPTEVLRIMTELIGCCDGAAGGGPEFCTCWEPEFAEEQELPKLDMTPGTRHQMCADCAFRPDSPERNGDERYQHSDDGELDELPTFWCHQGMRKPLRWRHPAGITVEASCDYYRPPIISGVPFRADGTPGEHCAGWAARNTAREKGLVS